MAELSAASAFAARGRWRWPEIVIWVAVVASAFIFSDHLVLLARILVTALFALSLDLLLGYGGMVSLGHAVFFGVGAYAAGVITQHGWTEPISGLIFSTLFCALLGYATSFVIVKLKGVALLMVTMGMGLLVYELGNALPSITGGTDGMNGVTIDPILGYFEFDIFGRTAFGYALVVTFLGFCLVRRIVNAPFGLSLQGYRENPARMAQIGAPMAARLRVVNTLAGGLAGLSGALLTQTTQFAGLDELSFQNSAEVLIVLILGGGGRLYGGLIGAAVFTVGRNWLAAATPEFWYFWLGLVLVLIVMFMPEGLVGGCERLWLKLRAKHS